MTSEIQSTHQDFKELYHKLIIEGDLGKLPPSDRVEYYLGLCKHLGLSPLSKPFELISFQGKLRLYATKNCTDQMRAINNISIEIVSQQQIGDLYVVTTKAITPSGRVDTDLGAVVLKGMTGESAANQIMKAVSKSKRRVTLSICGLSILDESELDTINGYQKVPMDMHSGALQELPIDNRARVEGIGKAYGFTLKQAAEIAKQVTGNQSLKAQDMQEEDFAALESELKKRTEKQEVEVDGISY